MRSAKRLHLDRSRRLARQRGAPAGLVVLAAIAFAEGARMIVSATPVAPSGPPGWYLCIIAALLMITVGFWVVADHRSPKPDEEPTEPPGGSEGLTRTWRALGLMALYAYALPWIGFAITTTAFLVIYLFWVAHYPIIRAIAYGLAIAVVTVVLFEQLGIVLPSGAYGI